MKSVASAVLVWLVAVWLVVPAGARDVSEADRARLVDELRRTETLFVDSFKGLTEDQWKWKAAPERWSVAEAAEHIAISETTILGLIQTKMLSAAPPPGMLEKTRGKDDVVLKAVPDRTERFQAPEMLRPKGQWATRDALAADFRKARAQTIAFARESKIDLRAFAAPHPALGELDAYQWMLLISAHTERHTKQIEEVKADPAFPKRQD